MSDWYANELNFREYLRNAVIADKGEWDAKTAKGYLIDGNWLETAERELGIDSRELDDLAQTLYDECNEEIERSE